MIKVLNASQINMGSSMINEPTKCRQNLKSVIPYDNLNLIYASDIINENQ